MREHIEHILAAGGAVAVALFISYFHTAGPLPSPSSQAASESPASTSPALSAVSTTSPPSLIISTSTFEKIFQTAPIKASAPAPAKVVQTTSTPAKPSVVAAIPAASTTPPVETPSDASPLLGTLSKSIVNILCIANDGSLHSISGSGVIIDSRGIILTVAHVAQAVLLEEYLGASKESCVVRTGSPAHNAYLVPPYLCLLSLAAREPHDAHKLAADGHRRE